LSHPPVKAGGLRPDRAAEQIRTHENKFAEIDYMVSERGDPELWVEDFECRNKYRHFSGDYIIFIEHCFALANICTASR
jgi:hypothetical protein